MTRQIIILATHLQPIMFNLMALRRLLICVSIVLLIFLAWGSVKSIDLAPTKNRHLHSFNKQLIDDAQNIDTVKSLAKRNLDRQYRTFQKRSSEATQRLWMLSALVTIQVFLLFSKGNQRKTSE